MRVRITTKEAIMPPDLSHKVTVALAEVLKEVVWEYGVPAAQEAAPKKTRELADSIQAGEVVITGLGKVRASLLAKAKHARAVDQGAGVFVGEEPWTVTPKKSRGPRARLQFEDGSLHLSAVIPGQEAQHFMRAGLRAMKKPLLATTRKWLKVVASAKRR